MFRGLHKRVSIRRYTLSLGIEEGRVTKTRAHRWEAGEDGIRTVRQKKTQTAYREGFKVYCFKTDRAIRVFGNNGCRFCVESDVPTRAEREEVVGTRAE